MGYRRDPKDKHRLIIDEKGAEIVRYIFQLAGEGVKAKEIAKRLNDEGIITPSDYYAEKIQGTTQTHSALGKRWSYDSVYVILKRFSYTGALVTNKKSAPSVGSHKFRLQDKSKWIVVNNQYEPKVEVWGFMGGGQFEWQRQQVGVVV